MEQVKLSVSARDIARQEGVDIASLIAILQTKRPYNTDGEREFITEWLDDIEGMTRDTVGNRWLVIGDNPTILWSCHTDTVSQRDGFQNVRWSDDGTSLELNKPKHGQCLGADDGAGMWLLLEMIKAAKPGLYIFHRGEEKGGIGSGHIADKNPDLLLGIQMAVAFDRRGTSSIITHQSRGRGCSKEFATAFAEALNELEPAFDFKLDDTGSFTDTANYFGLVPECTNVSCGYYSEHSTREELDVIHLMRLRKAMIQIDMSKLPIVRDHTDTETWSRDWGDYSYGGSYYSQGGWGGTHGASRYGSLTQEKKFYNPTGYKEGSKSLVLTEEDELEEIARLLERFSEEVAEMFYAAGYTADDLAAKVLEIRASQKPTTLPAVDDYSIIGGEVFSGDPEGTHGCMDCYGRFTPTFDEKFCDYCYSENVVEIAASEDNYDEDFEPHGLN